MKRILTVLFLITACANVAYANENANQKIVNEKTYASVNFEKAPEQFCTKQAISNKGSWFNVNIINCGKSFQVNSSAVQPAKQ